MTSMPVGRYRFRTWLRGHLPARLGDVVPKGARDCGRHEWYRADERTWRCYHCEPAISWSSPWTREEQLQHTLEAINTTLRMLADAGELHDEDLVELRRLVDEALAALPDEEHRLKRLVDVPATELPTLVEALQEG